MNQPDSVIALDVGNSALKVARWAGDDPNGLVGDIATQTTISLHEPEWISRCCDWLRDEMPSAGTVSFWVSTVNRAASDPLRSEVSRSFPSSEWHRVEHASIPLELDVRSPDRVGIDRLVGAFGAANRFPRPFVLVDAGSAVTIDWIEDGSSGKPRFCGGAIMPGIGLQLRVLASGTEGISPISSPSTNLSDETAPNFAPAKATGEAIQLGVLASVAGGIERLTREYGKHFQKNADKPACPSVLLTGGDALSIRQALSVPNTVVPNLVCRGLFDLSAISAARKSR